MPASRAGTTSRSRLHEEAAAAACCDRVRRYADRDGRIPDAGTRARRTACSTSAHVDALGLEPSHWRTSCAPYCEELRMRRLLVTGGAGFIGANFVHYWLARIPAIASWCSMR